MMTCEKRQIISYNSFHPSDPLEGSLDHTLTIVEPQNLHIATQAFSLTFSIILNTKKDKPGSPSTVLALC